MGGGHRFPYPKYVWSPSGGWWPSPVHWKRNTLIAFAFQFSFAFVLCIYAEKNTISYVPRRASEHELKEN